MGIFKKILPPGEITLQDLIEQKFEVFSEQAKNLRKDPFTFAMCSYYTALKYGDVKRPGILTIVDYELVSATQIRKDNRITYKGVPRLFILDLEHEKVIYQGVVAHGSGSGWKRVVSYSNIDKSNESSIGTFITGEEYPGKKGRSVYMHGLEKGINDRAFDRELVLHTGINPDLEIPIYVSDEFIEEHGYVGRTNGCFGVRPEAIDLIIDTIKDGTVFFVYYPDSDYLSTSKYTNRKTAEEKLTEIQEKGRDILSDTIHSRSH